MDLHRYVGAISLWLWPVLGRNRPRCRRSTRRPSITATICASGRWWRLLGSAIPDSVRPWLEPVPGREPGRTLRERATRAESSPPGWRDDVMIGAEDNDAGWPAWHQSYPATVHWARGRRRHRLGAAGAQRPGAGPRRRGDAHESSAVRRRDGSQPHLPRGSRPISTPKPSNQDRWLLPGLEVDLESDAQLDEVSNSVPPICWFSRHRPERDQPVLHSG